MNLEQAIKSTHFKSGRHKAGLNILYTAWWIKTVISAELKKYGLTHEQYNVLRILKGKSPEKMCVGDIGSRMIEKNSNVPRIIDRLEAKKMVKRSVAEADKRQTFIAITTVGLHLLEIATKDVEKIIDAQMDINEEEAQKLNTLLEAFRKKE